MLRLVAVVTILFAVDCQGVQAQGRSHRGYSRPTPHSFGVDRYGHLDYGYAGPYPVYGFGYVQDPYQSGHFEAPDLLDDPYFRAQHKFDSRYPGRYSRRPPLVLQGSVPETRPHPRRRSMLYPSR